MDLETGGYVVYYLGTFYLIREGRNPEETKSHGMRVACWDKVQYLKTKGWIVVAGLHIHPSGGSNPSPGDKESIVERSTPEIIVARTGKYIFTTEITTVSEVENRIK